jgi:ADP-ribosylglycohydrolase
MKLMEPSPDLLDRAIGALVGTAVGDALGAGYEFDTYVDPTDVEMLPGRLTGRPAGNWTDDTDMAMAIALAASEHGTLTTQVAQTQVAENFLAWYASQPPDVGMQTRAVLRACHEPHTMNEVAAKFQSQRPDAAGNGSLMRTAPVALADLEDLEGVAESAAAISALTHPHLDAQDACVLWSVAIALGVNGSPSLCESMNGALAYVDPRREARWRDILTEAEECELEDLAPNGWVVRALQAAWRAALEVEQSDPAVAYADGVRFAISLGDDTDTIAAIAGGLLGAHYGALTIPTEWRAHLAGWPTGYGNDELSKLAVQLVTGAN